MTTVTENDLKRVEDKIDKLGGQIEKLTDVVNNLAIGQAELKGEFKALEQNLNGQIKALEENVNGKIVALEENVNGQIKALEETLNGKIVALDATVKGLDKRLDNIEGLNRIVSGGVILAILSAVIKYWFFPNFSL